MQVELDMPGRTTRDYDAPTLAPHVRAALDDALKGEEDVDIDASRSIFQSEAKIRATRKESRIGVLKNGYGCRPKTSSSGGTRSNRTQHQVHPHSNSAYNQQRSPQSDTPDAVSHFPQSRGLVPK